MLTIQTVVIQLIKRTPLQLSIKSGGNVESNILILLIIAISALVLAIGACILAGFSLYYSLKAHLVVLAMEKSTHTVTYAPIDKEIDEANKAWSTKQDTLDKEQKMYQEDIENEMPEFASDEDDKKIYSF